MVGSTKTPPLDWPGLLESLYGDEDFARELAATYIDSGESLLSALNAAIGCGDCAAVASNAHALKGASANMGVGGVADAAAMLESAARAGETSQLDNLAARLARELAEVIDFLRGKVAS